MALGALVVVDRDVERRNLAASGPLLVLVLRMLLV